MFTSGPLNLSIDGEGVSFSLLYFSFFRLEKVRSVVVYKCEIKRNYKRMSVVL